jgi:hypothetical protein
MMKRLVMLSAACALLASAYAVWLERQRRLQAQERSLTLQIWETEGGSPEDKTSPNPADATYS